MDIKKIQNRRVEVKQEIARLESRISTMTSELADLDTAERVVLRLSGAERHPARPANEPKPEKASVTKPEGIPPMTEMIVLVLREARGRGIPGLEPKEMHAAITKKFWPNAPADRVNPIAWRLWSKGLLVKAKDSARYSLPEKNKAADELPLGGTSAALSPTAKGREAGPGGGT